MEKNANVSAFFIAKQLFWFRIFYHCFSGVSVTASRDFLFISMVGFRFIKALYLLETGQYEDSFDILPNTSPVNDIQIACKRLELRVLYELNSDLLSYRMDAFKMYLHRTSPKLHAEGLRKKNHQFHILLQQIIQCPPSNSKRVERLIQRVRENRFAADWAWLLQKAEALKSKKI